VKGRQRDKSGRGAGSNRAAPIPGGAPGGGAHRRYTWVLLAVPLAVGLIALRGASAEDSGVPAEAEIWQLTPEQLEARIVAQLAAGETATLDWRVLEQLNHRTGERSALLGRLDGQVVRVPGFAVPLEDYAEEFSEFLVVPWAGACIHTPPPPPNQMVYARMKAGRKASTPWWEPVWVEGTLHVVPTMSPYGAVGYQMEGLTVVILER
jgi:uncharacterized protein